MNGKAWSRRVAEVVVPMACLAVVSIGYWAYSRPEPAARQVEIVDPPPLPAPPPPPVVPEPAVRPPGKAFVVAGMNRVKPAIAACYAEYRQPGVAMVTVVIGRDGTVDSATVTGRFAATPTGRCVEHAVKTATFPPSDVGLTTPYPFMLK